MSTLSVADAKVHLNIAAGNTDHDDELQAVIDAAESTLTEHVGPLASVATTHRVRGGGAYLVLPTTPAVSLTSVTPVGGSALTVDDLFVTDWGTVEWESGGTFPERWYDVVYQAGRATLPDDLLMAVKELVRHLWLTQRGPTARPGSRASEGTANTVPGAAYILPFRVAELIGPHKLAPHGA